MGSVNWLLKHGVYQDWQPVAEDEVSDKESSTHSPHQPQQVEGVQTGPIWHTGLASLDYFPGYPRFFLALAIYVGEIHSV